MNLGKKVKVRDMKPGWTYRVPGKTLEEIYESAHEYAKWPPVQMTDAKQNTGLLLLKVTEDNKNNWDDSSKPYFRFLLLEKFLADRASVLFLSAQLLHV